MEKNKILIGVGVAAVLIVAIVLIVQTFQIGSIKKELSGVTGSAIKQIDTSGWTENEKMNYEMHGTLPAGYQGNTNQQTKMVGGC